MPSSRVPRHDPCARFLNVDLELSSKHDLAPVLQALAPDAFVLHAERRRGKHFARLELEREPRRRSADAIIGRFAELVERLPPLTRRCWNQATTRELSIGLNGGIEPPWIIETLTPETVRRLARIGAAVGITVYAVEQPERGHSRSAATSAFAMSGVAVVSLMTLAVHAQLRVAADVRPRQRPQSRSGLRARLTGPTHAQVAPSTRALRASLR